MTDAREAAPAARPPGRGDVALFFGQIAPYKGLEYLDRRLDDPARDRHADPAHHRRQGQAWLQDYWAGIQQPSRTPASATAWSSGSSSSPTRRSSSTSRRRTSSSCRTRHLPEWRPVPGVRLRRARHRDGCRLAAGRRHRGRPASSARPETPALAGRSIAILRASCTDRGRAPGGDPPPRGTSDIPGGRRADHECVYTTLLAGA